LQPPLANAIPHAKSRLPGFGPAGFRGRRYEIMALQKITLSQRDTNDQGQFHTITGVVIKLIRSRSEMMCGWETVSDDDLPLAEVEWEGLLAPDHMRLHGEGARTYVSSAAGLAVGDRVVSAFASLGPDYRHDIDYYTPLGWAREKAGRIRFELGLDGSRTGPLQS
jgi:hypothetical protein